jgi:CheY-like chemotaxis protein
MSGVEFENLKALIVEDNAHMRALMRALLNSAGVKEIAEAAHGLAALEALRERKDDDARMGEVVADELAALVARRLAGS